jgi:hypothetical protein
MNVVLTVLELQCEGTAGWRSVQSDEALSPYGWFRDDAAECALFVGLAETNKTRELPTFPEPRGKTTDGPGRGRPQPEAMYSIVHIVTLAP